MAVKNYKWGAAITIESGGFVGEVITISDGSQSRSMTVGPSSAPTFWFDEHTSTSDTGSATYTYTYQDLDGPLNGTGYLCQVSLTIRDSWSVSVDPVTNKMRVSVTTTFVSGRREPIRNQQYARNWQWEIIVKRSSAGQALIDLIDTTGSGDPHTISGLVDKPLGSYTYTISPGQETSQASVWYRNVFYGYTDQGQWAPSLPWPNIYTDVFGVGIHFKNILPPPTTYKIIYDANGGTGAPAQQSASTAEGSYTFTVASGTPSWGVYRFLGWSRTRYDRSCTLADVEYTAGDIITLQEANPTLTLYACWEKDYRPGQIIDNNGIWQSHNRPTGADNIRTDSTWQTMRTIDGGASSDNPPYMRHPSDWKNQRRIGANS